MRELGCALCLRLLLLSLLVLVLLSPLCSC
jgi:hypothetical protein